jgi:hypothetical protein
MKVIFCHNIFLLLQSPITYIYFLIFLIYSKGVTLKTYEKRLALFTIPREFASDRVYLVYVISYNSFLSLVIPSLDYLPHNQNFIFKERYYIILSNRFSTTSIISNA